MELDCVCGDEVVRSLLRCQHPAHCLLKGHRYIGGILGTGFIIGEVAVLFAPLLSLLSRHLPLRHIQFVAQDDERELLRLLDVRVVDELLLPVAQIEKTLAVIYAEGEQAAVRAAIERSPQAAEALLASRVPDLQGHLVAIHLQLLVEELHADGVEKVRIELVGDVAIHEGAFSHTAVTQQDDFQQGCLCCHGCSLLIDHCEIMYLMGRCNLRKTFHYMYCICIFFLLIQPVFFFVFAMCLVKSK